MAKAREVYFDDCRFTDRQIDIVTHGHGIKISIRTGPAKGEVVSVFLDAGQTSDLLGALYEANIPATAAPPAVSRLAAGERRITELESVLSKLASVLTSEGF